MLKQWKQKTALLAVCVLLAGCSVGQATSDQSTISLIPAGAKTIALVNSATEEAQMAYAPESPTITASILEAGGERFKAAAATPDYTGSDEVRAVWISYLEFQSLLTSRTQAQFTQNMGVVFDNAKKFGLNAVIVQVRPFGDALYESDYFPWSHIITGTEGKDPGFDPLQIMVDLAKERSLRIDAWVNPYRVRQQNSTAALSSNNQAKKWLDAGDGAAIQYGGFISYNPASEKARTLIVNGVKEIVRKYGVDAVHIDDYFYPTTDTAFDKASYDAYIAAGGTKSQGDWRRENVEKLIRSIYTAVKEENPSVLFGISPQGNVQVNNDGQYFDAEKIVSSTGYCDYICPQIYYGFQNKSQPYAQVVEQWDNMIATDTIDLYVGLAAYKIGVQDNWAGTGLNEWVKSTTQLRDMVQTARGTSHYKGFIIYRYESIFSPAAGVKAQVEQERSNLRSIL